MQRIGVKVNCATYQKTFDTGLEGGKCSLVKTALTAIITAVTMLPRIVGSFYESHHLAGPVSGWTQWHVYSYVRNRVDNGHLMNEHTCLDAFLQ